MRISALVCICALAVPFTAAAQTPVGPAWLSPTPVEGESLAVAAWSTLSFSVAASSPDLSAALHIAGSSLPPGATLDAVDGNPATASFTWRPGADDVGVHALMFTAGPGVERRITIRVAPERPVALSTVDALSRAAFVKRAVAARARPDAHAPVVARVGTMTEEYARNLVLALASAHDADGNVWVKARLSILPNNSTGWIPRAALGPFHAVRTRLVIDRAFFTATLFRDGAPVFRTRVGVGTPGWPTPRGEFYVRELLTNFGDPFYGPAAFGTSAKSPVPTGYFAGAFIGIHGTNAPELIPGRISHGCIRLRNPAILQLVKLMPLGTPVTVR
jgi:lipoprotein-anchoring transpeptidase ErfK/SrfK